MASTSYQLMRLDCEVFQSLVKPKLQHPPSPFIQIDLHIVLDLDIVAHECSTGTFIDSRIKFSSTSHRFNLDVLKNQELAYRTIAPLLTRVGLLYPHAFNNVINNITGYGLRIANCESNKDHQVFAIDAYIWGEVREHVDDRASIRRALAASNLEFERNNYGMVPAKKSEVEKMLKITRLEDGNQSEVDKESMEKRKVKSEDCVICLEEIKIGSAALTMPCSHIFHEKCIETWLNQSHYCPICRFEVPT